MTKHVMLQCVISEEDIGSLKTLTSTKKCIIMSVVTISALYHHTIKHNVKGAMSARGANMML